IHRCEGGDSTSKGRPGTNVAQRHVADAGRGSRQQVLGTVEEGPRIALLAQNAEGEPATGSEKTSPEHCPARAEGADGRHYDHEAGADTCSRGENDHRVLL